MKIVSAQGAAYIKDIRKLFSRNTLAECSQQVKLLVAKALITPSFPALDWLWRERDKNFSILPISAWLLKKYAPEELKRFRRELSVFSFLFGKEK